MFDINSCYKVFCSKPTSAYFWSGPGAEGKTIAAKVAEENDGVTIETLMERNKDALISAGFPYDEDVGGFLFF